MQGTDFYRVSLAVQVILRLRVLVIQNAEWEGPGLIGPGARAAGASLTTIPLFGKEQAETAASSGGHAKQHHS
jgi:hypothetical protein